MESKIRSTLDKHKLEAAQVISKIQKWDFYGMFRSARQNRNTSETDTNQIQFHDLVNKLKTNKYTIHTDTFFRQGNNSTTNEIDRNTTTTTTATNDSPDDNKQMVDWDLLLTDFQNVCYCLINQAPSIDELAPSRRQGTVRHEVDGLLAKGTRAILQVQDRILHQTDLDIGPLGALRKAVASNPEPGVMRRWRTVPYPKRSYMSIQTSTPAPGNPIQQLHVNTHVESKAGVFSVCYECDDDALHRDWVANKAREMQQNNPALSTHAAQLSFEKISAESVKDRKRREEFARNCLTNNAHTTPPMTLGQEVDERPVWGIDCRTRYNIMCVVRHLAGISQHDAEIAITKILLPTINNMPSLLAHDMNRVAERLLIQEDSTAKLMGDALLRAIRELGLQHFKIFPKGTGVVALQNIPPYTFVCEYVGELYAPYRWRERQAAIAATARLVRVTPPVDFYNLIIERPSSNPGGYMQTVVDASEMGNFASSLSHSCDGNVETITMSREDGRLMVAMCTTHHEMAGEELTYDYSACTSSTKEWVDSACLCGMPDCRGFFLFFAGESRLNEVRMRAHPPLKSFADLLRASAWVGSAARVADQDAQSTLTRHGISSAVLGDESPAWLSRWVAGALKFVEHERGALPCALIAPADNSEGGEVMYSHELACVTARGIVEQRIQSLIATVSTIRYVLSKQTVQIQPLQLMPPEAVVWELLKSPESVAMRCARLASATCPAAKGLVELISQKALECAPHSLRQCHATLLFLRTKLLALPSSRVARHHAAADILLLLAHTQTFVKLNCTQPVLGDPMTVCAKHVGMPNIVEPETQKPQPSKPSSKPRKPRQKKGSRVSAQSGQGVVSVSNLVNAEAHPALPKLVSNGCVSPVPSSSDQDTSRDTKLSTTSASEDDNDSTSCDASSSVGTIPIPMPIIASRDDQIHHHPQQHHRSISSSDSQSIAHSTNTITATSAATPSLVLVSSRFTANIDLVNRDQNAPVTLSVPVYPKGGDSPNAIECAVEEWRRAGEEVLTIYRHDYTSDAIVTTVVNWHEPDAATNAMSWQAQVLGSAILPDIAGCYLGEAEYSHKTRMTLMKRLYNRAEHGLHWPKEIQAVFGEKPLNIIGSPVLDAALGNHSNLDTVCSLMSDEARVCDSDNNSDNADNDTDLLKQLGQQLEDDVGCNWVQCEASECGKWRRVPWWVDYEEVKNLPEFKCVLMRQWGAMYADSGACDYPEDTWDDAEDKIISCGWGEGEPSVGHMVDAFCAKRKAWLQAQVVDADQSRGLILVRWRGRTPHLQEWLSRTSSRLVPPRTKSVVAVSKSRGSAVTTDPVDRAARAEAENASPMEVPSTAKSQRKRKHPEPSVSPRPTSKPKPAQ